MKQNEEGLKRALAYIIVFNLNKELLACRSNK
jgi:hypothetical protein